MNERVLFSVARSVCKAKSRCGIYDERRNEETNYGVQTVAAKKRNRRAEQSVLLVDLTVEEAWSAAAQTFE